jgi:hypothetical protein
VGRVRPFIARLAVALLAVGMLPTAASAAESNQPPVAVDDPGQACGPNNFGGSYPIPEDPIEPMVLAIQCAPMLNDSDPDGDVMTPELVTDASHGAATIAGFSDDFNWATYMPEDDYFTDPGNVPGGSWQSDAFTYRVTDGQAWSNPATYRLWVAPINDPPTFTPGPSLVVGTADGGAHSSQWATNIDPGPGEDDQDVHFEVMHVDLSGVPNLFAVPPAIDDDGVLTFTPGPGEVGLAQVTVHAVDEGGTNDWGTSGLAEPPDDASDPVTFEIVVSNHAPIANDDPDPEGSCSPVGALVVIEDTKNPYLLAGSCGPLTNDTDPDGDFLTGELVEQASHGTVTWETVESNGEPETWVLYMPDADWSTPLGVGPPDSWASDSFTYRATDGTLWSDPANYWIWVAPINDPPTFDYVQQVNVGQDSGASAVQWATNIDPGPNEDDQSISFEIVDIPVLTNPDLFAVPPSIDENGVLTFTPALHQSGAAVVLARAKDDGGLEDWQVDPDYLSEAPADTSEIVDFGIVVDQNPYPLIGADQDLAIPHGAGPTRLDLLANDSDPDDEALKVVQVTQGAHGSVAIVENGAAVTYDPDSGYSGPDTFDYVIEDTRGGQAWAPVTVVVAEATSDTTAPTVGSLARSLPAQAIGASSVKVALSWKGTDVGTGVASYRLERRIGSGAWTKVTLPTPTTRSTTATLTIDTAYTYRVRATDVAGNVGAWATFPTLNPKRIQDTSSLVAYTGTWTKVTNSSLSGGSARYASSTTRRAKVSFTGQEIALIATRRTTGGRAEIRVDGVVVGTVDLDASSTQYRRLVFRKGFAGSAPHSLEVRPLGDGRVEIDAFIVLR